MCLPDFHFSFHFWLKAKWEKIFIFKYSFIKPWFVSHPDMEIIHASVKARRGSCHLSMHHNMPLTKLEPLMYCIRGKQQKRSTFRDRNRLRNVPQQSSDKENNWQGCSEEQKAADSPEAQLLLGIALHIEKLLHIPLLSSNLRVLSVCWTGLNSSSNCCLGKLTEWIFKLLDNVQDWIFNSSKVIQSQLNITSAVFWNDLNCIEPLRQTWNAQQYCSPVLDHTILHIA